MSAATQTLNQVTQPMKASMKKVVLSGMIGNGLEWYDYALYAQMSFIISELFFPGTNESAKLIATFGVFAVGFVFRPVGAVLFGYIGDRYGRRTSLVIAILMMAIPTGCIGLLPTYAQIGILAPILLTAIRILQGLSLGGEFSGSIAYIVEHATEKNRGLAGCACIVSLIIGFLAGSFVSMLFVKALSPEAFHSWGWRVPFLLGIVIGIVGLYIRAECEESPAYEEAKSEGHLSDKPLRTAFCKYPLNMLQAFAIYISVTMPFYLVSVYLLSFSQKKLGLPVADALFINTTTMVTMLASVIIFAVLSDKIGRKPILVVGAIVMMATVAPLFNLMGTAVYSNVLTAQILLGFIVGAYVSVVPTVLVEIFPTSIRFTGMAISYNLAAAVFGGTAPMVCEWLIGSTGTFMSIAWYVIACNVISLIALYFYKDKFREPLLQS
jgi:MHS family proline/betaine transporter-like MFS transporter